jgi:hypothetical protein
VIYPNNKKTHSYLLLFIHVPLVMVKSPYIPRTPHEYRCDVKPQKHKISSPRKWGSGTLSEQLTKNQRTASTFVCRILVTLPSTQARGHCFILLIVSERNLFRCSPYELQGLHPQPSVSIAVCWLAPLYHAHFGSQSAVPQARFFDRQSGFCREDFKI